MCVQTAPPPPPPPPGAPLNYDFFSSKTLAARFKTRHGLWLFTSGARSLGAAEALHFLGFLDGGSDCSLALALFLALALGVASDGSAAPDASPWSASEASAWAARNSSCCRGSSGAGFSKQGMVIPNSTTVEYTMVTSEGSLVGLRQKNGIKQAGLSASNCRFWRNGPIVQVCPPCSMRSLVSFVVGLALFTMPSGTKRIVLRIALVANNPWGF